MGTLEAGSGTIEITTSLLLLSSGQQRKHRTIQLLVSRQAAAGNAAGLARHRGAEAALTRSRRLAAHGLVESQTTTGGDRLRIGLQRRRDRPLRHHHHDPGILFDTLRLCRRTLTGRGTRAAGRQRSTGIDHRNRTLRYRTATTENRRCQHRGKPLLVHIQSSSGNTESLDPVVIPTSPAPSPSPTRPVPGYRKRSPGQVRCREYKASALHSGSPKPSPSRSADRSRPG